MKRELDLNEVSDGKKYTENDLVKMGCNECKGCSDCCKDMDKTIVLDPFDINRMTCGLDITFEQLLGKHVDLQVVDSVILPYLLMSTPKGACTFLKEDGRCSIHAFRPGICRLFPLGRIYEDEEYTYFHQIHECKYKNKTKIKISKWLGQPNLKQYHAYILAWHTFLKYVEDRAMKAGASEDIAVSETIKAWNMDILKILFFAPYSEEVDFYEQFYQRLDIIRGKMN